MDRQTKKTLNELYKKQKQAKKNFNYYELSEINKQIFEIVRFSFSDFYGILYLILLIFLDE